MRKPEQRFWDDIRKEMTGRWSATRIENTATSGLPDVEWSGAGQSGWLELKVIPRARAGEPLVITHLRPEQANWMHTRATRGDGRADLLIRIEKLDGIGQCHMLIPARLAMDVYDRKFLMNGIGQHGTSILCGSLGRHWLWSTLRTESRYETPVA